MEAVCAGHKPGLALLLSRISPTASFSTLDFTATFSTPTLFLCHLTSFLCFPLLHLTLLTSYLSFYIIICYSAMQAILCPDLIPPTDNYNPDPLPMFLQSCISSVCPVGDPGACQFLESNSASRTKE